MTKISAGRAEQVRESKAGLGMFSLAPLCYSADVGIDVSPVRTGPYLL